MGMRIVWFVFIASILSQAQPCRDIRSFDFRNSTIHTSETDENELRGFNGPFGAQTFNFKDGVSADFVDEAEHKTGTPEHRARISKDSVLTAVTGVVVRFLTVTLNDEQGTGAHSYVFGFVCRDHAVQQIFKFSAEYGPHFTIGPGNQLVITQAIWSEQDAHCCPTKTRTLYYTWNVAEQRFRRVRVDGPKPAVSR